MRRLELLQPCDYEPARHGERAPDGSVQCAGCRKAVVDLSAMTSAEAHAFLDRRRDECVSLRVNERDEVLLRDVPDEPIVARVAANARPMILVAALMAAACGPGATVESEAVDARPVAATASARPKESDVSAPLSSAVTVDAEVSTKDAGVVARPTGHVHPPVKRLAGAPPPPRALGGY